MSEWTEARVETILDVLRERGGDSVEVEVKNAHGGVSEEQVPETLCAFANMPAGGTLILGVDEDHGRFNVTGLDKVAETEAAVASQARGVVDPPVTLTPYSLKVSGKDVLVIEVAGLPLRDRPARWRGKAYLRQSDGDYVMSESELRQIEVNKLSQEEFPDYDLRCLRGTSSTELDKGLISQFLEGVRESSRRLSSVTDDAELLRLMSVVADSGNLTLAGNYALGFYPQGHDPSLAVTIAERLDVTEGGDRTRDLERIDGPVPVLLEQVMSWIRAHLSRTQRQDGLGNVRDHYELPLIAVREAVANALVHRDLGPNTLGAGKAVDIRLYPNKLIIHSPGGLKGLTVESLLGRDLSRTEVNPRLYAIAERLLLSDGTRVIEGEGGGVREILRAMKEEGLPEPDFIDRGVSFTVIFWRPNRNSWQPSESRPSRRQEQNRESADVEEVAATDDAATLRRVSKNAPAVIQALRETSADALTLQELADATSLSLAQVRYVLKAVIERGLVVMDGGQGVHNTRYRLA